MELPAGLQCVERSLLPKAKISSTTHAQLLHWLHGKQQQQKWIFKQNCIGICFINKWSVFSCFCSVLALFNANNKKNYFYFLKLFLYVVNSLWRLSDFFLLILNYNSTILLCLCISFLCCIADSQHFSDLFVLVSVYLSVCRFPYLSIFRSYGKCVLLFERPNSKEHSC